jgi:hypothetical protein
LNFSSKPSKLTQLFQSENKWIIDSRATDHTTYDVNKLRNFTPLNNSQHIKIVNGNKVQIYGIDTTKLLSKDIKKIFYIY